MDNTPTTPAPEPRVYPYWVSYQSHGICVFAVDADAARALAEAKDARPVRAVDALPYPAIPQLNPEANTRGIPAFCYRPRECKNKTSCDARPACTE